MSDALGSPIDSGDEERRPESAEIPATIVSSVPVSFRSFIRAARSERV
jgi:hypothetical protein